MQKRKPNKFFLLFLLFSFLFFTSCGQEVLYNNLNQEDANKVMVLLEQHGIHPSLDSEVKQNETFWTIKIASADVARARELIVTSQVITPKAPSLQDVYQTKGGGSWIKTPAEERARYLLALKGEVVNALRRLPEVIDADVVLNIPETAKLGSKEASRPTASVIIKSQKPKAGESGLSEVTIQQWVANTVEGLAARDVVVMIHFIAPLGTTLRPGDTVTLPGVGESVDEHGRILAPTTPLMGLALDPKSRARLKIYLVIFFSVLVLLSLGLILTIMQSSRQRQEIKSLKGGETPQQLEGGGETQRPKLRSGSREET